jgi:hypothetical protein
MRGFEFIGRMGGKGRGSGSGLFQGALLVFVMGY